MKTIIEIKQGDPIPEGARYLSTIVKIECGPKRQQWMQTPGIMGMIPIFGTETLYEITPRYEVTYAVYEIDKDPHD